MLSVILPTYNQAHLIRDSVVNLWGFLRNRIDGFEILVVDDGSTDGTYEVVKSISIEMGVELRPLRLERNLGKGAAVAAAVKEATGEHIFFTDADLPYDTEGILKGLQLLVEKGFDMAVGDRDHGDSRVLVEYPLRRRLLKEIFGVLCKALVGTPLKDTQCGLKGFKADVAKRLFSSLTVKGFCFDVELLVMAQEMGLALERFPVKFVRDSTSSLRLFRDSLKMGLDLLHIARRKRVGLYRREMGMPMPGSSHVSEQKVSR